MVFGVVCTYVGVFPLELFTLCLRNKSLVWGFSLVEEYLPSEHKALGLVLSSGKKGSQAGRLAGLPKSGVCILCYCQVWDV